MSEPKSYAKAVGLFGFDETVQRMGGNPAMLYERTKLAPDLLTYPDQLISFQKYCNLLEYASAMVGRNFALNWALDLQPHFPNLGPVAWLANFVGTAGEWIETGLRYWALHANGFRLGFVSNPDKDLRTLRYFADSFVLPASQVVEHAFSCMVLLARHRCNAPHEAPTVVRFQHAKPTDTSLHEAIFNCPIYWGQEHSDLTFESRFLELSTGGRLQFLKPLLAYYVRRRIDKLDHYDQSASTHLMLAIPSVIGTGHCKIQVLAEALGTNVKALQRQLAEEGTSFSNELDRVRQNLAKNYLLQTSIPVARIAELLEYSATAPFTTAFQRWTNMSPLKFRQKFKHSEDDLP